MTSSRDPAGMRIVVGVDGSTQSKQALRWAASAAKASGAIIDAVAAWEYPANFGWVTVPNDWNPGTAMEKALSATVDEVFGTDRPVGMRLSVVEGYPTAVLLDASKDALMLIVGSRGHGGFAGLLLGSVSASVAEHATCPVLVVHGDRNPWDVIS